MLLQRCNRYWTNTVAENEIWKDRVRTECKARQNDQHWQFLYAEYEKLYSRSKNKNSTRPPAKKFVNFNRIPEKPNARRKGFPETRSAEIGWRQSTGNKLEMFGINPRGLKSKRDIYKTFNWPQN